MATPAAQRRLDFRNKLFAGAEARTWNRKTNDGYCTVPRLLPYVMSLIRSLSEKKGDPSLVYFDLWSRAFDEGLCTITDEGIAAFESGYSGTRAVRTWRERMDVLHKLGFIEPRAAGNRLYAHVLILNPLHVVCELRRTQPKKVPDKFWNAFLARAQEIGATLPYNESSETEEHSSEFHDAKPTIGDHIKITEEHVAMNT